MFYGYGSKQAMIDANPNIADSVIFAAKRHQATRATAGKECTGSIEFD